MRTESALWLESGNGKRRGKLWLRSGWALAPSPALGRPPQEGARPGVGRAGPPGPGPQPQAPSPSRGRCWRATGPGQRGGGCGRAHCPGRGGAARVALQRGSGFASMGPRGQGGQSVREEAGWGAESLGGALGQAWAAGEPAAGPSRVCWGCLSGEREGQCRLRRRSLGEVKVAAARRGGRRRRPQRTPPRGCHEQRVAACGVTGPPSVAGLRRGCPLPAFTAMRGSS